MLSSNSYLHMPDGSVGDIDSYVSTCVASQTEKQSLLYSAGSLFGASDIPLQAL